MIPGALSIWRRRVVARMTENLSRALGPTGLAGDPRLGGDDDCRPGASRLSNAAGFPCHRSNNSPSDVTTIISEGPVHATVDDSLLSDVDPRRLAGRPGPGRRGALPQR